MYLFVDHSQQGVLYVKPWKPGDTFRGSLRQSQRIAADSCKRMQGDCVETSKVSGFKVLGK
jgi:hypothetical protein